MGLIRQQKKINRSKKQTMRELKKGDFEPLFHLIVPVIRRKKEIEEGSMSGYKKLATLEKKEQVLMKMKLECLRISEQLHHLNIADHIKQEIQDRLSWMFHQIKYYENEEDITQVYEDFNWMIERTSQDIDSNLLHLKRF